MAAAMRLPCARAPPLPVCLVRRQTDWEATMECIQGRSALQLDALTLARRLDGYRDILVDLGTGDGQFVRHMAEACPARFAIGIDACRENLRLASRRAPPNALYLIASAQDLKSTR